MAKPRTNSERRLAIEVFTAAGIIALFLMILSITFINPVLGPMLVIFLCVILLGLFKKKRPELFKAIRKAKPSNDTSGSQSEPSDNQETHRAYMMLIGLNASSKYRVIVNDSPFIIGTDKKCSFVVEDKYVSRQHLQIEYDDEAKTRFVMDLSRNGTFLNGQRLQKEQRAALRHGDTLQIGSIIFSVEYVHF